MTVAILGIDGGGTSTTAWVADAEGRILGRGRSGPSNIKAIGAAAARDALDRAIRDALADAGSGLVPIAVSCLGLAGFDRPEDKRWLHEWADATPWARRLILVNDADLVLAAGTPDGHGVALIAGTGSIAIGRAPDGRSVRVGGWGHIFGDEGSGYGVAVAALRRIARRVDGREPTAEAPDPLPERLCRALDISGPEGLVSAVYAPGMDRTRIASLAPEVATAAAEGSALAWGVLDAAARDLFDQVLAVTRRIGIEGGPLPLALAGGFLVSTAILKRNLLLLLEGAGFQVRATEVAEPVVGAVQLALRALRG